MNGLKGVIFDVDGTLVDSNDAHARAFELAFRARGEEVPFAKIRPLIGMGADKLIPAALERPVPDAGLEAIGEEKSRIFRKEYLPGIKPFPRVRELLLRLRFLRMELAVASSAGKEELDQLLRAGEVSDLLVLTTSADDAESSKPSPEIVTAAREKLGMGPREVVMIGDTPYDVIAATRAGVRCIALRTGGWSAGSLKGAIEVHGSVSDLLDRWEHSILGS